MQKKPINKKPEKEKFKQSETVIIKRSQINFAPYNPKKHTEKSIKKQKENFKKVGFLGGIVWNEQTGNLISGHKRIMSMDLIMGYDGSPEKDYDVKVEKISLDLKTEMEQNVYMDSPDARTQLDSEALSFIMDDIDWDNAGLEMETVEMIFAEAPNFNFADNSEIKKELKTITDSGKDIKDVRKGMKSDIKKAWQEKPYMIITFDNIENKEMWCSGRKLDPGEAYFRGETIFSNEFE